MLKTIIKPATHLILDIIYPPQCAACGHNVHENGNICAKCWSDINFIADPQCNICGLPFDFAAPDGSICAACAQDKPHFSRARAVFLYDNASSRIITAFKYSDKIENRAAYARWMARVGSKMLEESDFIIPVPLHFGKLFLRKYNQAALLAHEIAKISDKKILANALIRKKYTKTQAQFSRKARFKNISGAFKLHPKYLGHIKGKNIILIDDVITTGATVEECAKILLKAGALRVEVLTLAKTLF